MSDTTVFDTTVFVPDYYRVLECRSGEWFLKKTKVLTSNLPFAVDFDDFELLYGVTREQVAIELFRVGGGRDGYYLPVSGQFSLHPRTKLTKKRLTW